MQLWERCMWHLAVAQKEQVSKWVICHILCHIYSWLSPGAVTDHQSGGRKGGKKKKNLFRVVGNLLLPPSQDICEAADQLDNLRSKQDVAEITPTMKRDSRSDTRAKRSPVLFLPPQPRHMGHIWDSCARSWQLLLSASSSGCLSCSQHEAPS